MPVPATAPATHVSEMLLAVMLLIRVPSKVPSRCLQNLQRHHLGAGGWSVYWGNWAHIGCRGVEPERESTKHHTLPNCLANLHVLLWPAVEDSLPNNGIIT